MARPAGKLTPDRSARHMFGAKVRLFREREDMTLEQLAGIVKYSRSHIARIEVAETIPPPDLPACLDAMFGTDGIFSTLYELAKHEIHPDQYRRRMELEARARVIDEYAGQLVPGLVQTEDYARALFRVSNPEASPAQIEEMVTARLMRQALLRADPPPYLSMILDEAVIRRPVGGPIVMRAQLASLAALVDTPTTLLQILPFEHGGHALMGGALTLTTLADRSCIAYEEGIDSGTLFEEPERASKRRREYDRLRAYALTPSRSADLIHDVMEALPK
ncbi:helix-turn-helix domain-containing protein [Kitasatospora mediocidica]|uniref:helix-turn-helix domain-containing protein n=1 Tax=Kitasatospora mediocidica TaxID=58352 RepID=UPI0005653068|nr:helix-turn-helix transcriptional regulator [Kitasatospora mediocidica]